VLVRARDYRDIIAGAALIVIGGLTAIYTLTSLKLGTTTRMGPGMFPTALSVLLIVFGIAVLIPALSRAGEMPKVDVVPLVAILISILAFALMVRPFGVVPAVVAMTAISSRADSKLSLRGTAILAAFLALLAALIFPIGLGLRIPIFAWPW